VAGSVEGIRCSIPAEAARRFDGLELGEIEIDNRPQGLPVTK
jgi:hypothetical protein